MVATDVVLSKLSIINNCLKTIETVTGNQANKLDEMMIQDVFVLNLQRAVQACIDIANYIIAQKGWRLPATYRESFNTLHENKVINKKLSSQMIKMVGFRNIAVHDYQTLDIVVLKGILEHNVDDFKTFRKAIVNFLNIE